MWFRRGQAVRVATKASKRTVTLAGQSFDLRAQTVIVCGHGRELVLRFVAEAGLNLDGSEAGVSGFRGHGRVILPLPCRRPHQRKPSLRIETESDCRRP